MLPADPGSPTPVFDSLIHYRASASFSGANVVLDTSLGADAASTSRNTAAGAVTEGVVRESMSICWPENLSSQGRIPPS